MADIPELAEKGAASGGKAAKGILKKKFLGIPVLYLAAAAVIAFALYAWSTKESSGEVDLDGDGEPDSESDAPNENDLNAGTIYPISPTGTVYAQSPQDVEDNVEYFGNDQWLQQAVAFLIQRGANPGEAQNALQAYLAGEDMTYDQGLLRDKAIKEFGIPPESFRAGKSATKPVATKPPSQVVVEKPVTKPKENNTSKPEPKPKPKPKPKRKTHKVVKGDTLWDLSEKYYGDATKWRKIWEANGKPNPRTLQIGRILVIP